MDEDNNNINVTAIKIANTIPEKAWVRLVKTACDTFEKSIAPLTETTSGIGRLIKSKFDSLSEAQKVLVSETFERGNDKVKKSEKNIPPQQNLNVIIRVIEESARQTNGNIRELWANLLAQEILSNNVHPEITNILSRIDSEDAKTLSYIAKKSADRNTLRDSQKGIVIAFGASFISAFGIISSVPLKDLNATFSEKLLESLNLIERKSLHWDLTIIGLGFIQAVTDPSINIDE
jgi:hypothetical protein